jgi:hypothetical protein
VHATAQNGGPAPTYHQTRFKYDPARAVVWRVVCNYLQRFVNEDHSLLDLGAGYGDFSHFTRAKEKWALDSNENDPLLA